VRLPQHGVLEFNKRIGAAETSDRKTKLNLSKCEMGDEQVPRTWSQQVMCTKRVFHVIFLALATADTAGAGARSQADTFQAGVGRKRHLNEGKTCLGHVALRLYRTLLYYPLCCDRRVRRAFELC
jgi:hypothetical protein